MTTKNYKLLDDRGRSWNLCDKYFTVDADYKKLRKELGIMNSISDKTAGWDLLMDDGTIICIWGRINDEDMTDTSHDGIDHGSWNVRSTDERAAYKAIERLTW